jgi:hypothetical protein
MPVEELLSRLEQHKIAVEDRKLPDGTRLLLCVTHLPSFPYGRRNAWHVLPLSPGQTDVAKQEVDSLLRHLCHAELDFFDKNNPFKDDENQ